MIVTAALAGAVGLLVWAVRLQVLVGRRSDHRVARELLLFELIVLLFSVSMAGYDLVVGLPLLAAVQILVTVIIVVAVRRWVLPPGYLTTDQIISPEQAEDLKARWNEPPSPPSGRVEP